MNNEKIFPSVGVQMRVIFYLPHEASILLPYIVTKLANITEIGPESLHALFVHTFLRPYDGVHS